MSSLLYYYFFSKYSQQCVQLSNTIKSLQPYMNIIPVDIDNRAVRQKIMTSCIKTVPCMIVQTPTSIEQFEGPQLLQFIQKTIMLIQQHNQAKSPTAQTVLYPNPTQVQSIVNPYQQQPPVVSQSIQDTTNARLAPPMISSPPPAPPILSTQLAQPNAIQQAAILQQQAQLQQQPQLLMQPQMQPQMPMNPLQVASQVVQQPMQPQQPMGVAQQQAMLAQGPIQQAVQPDAQQMQMMQQQQMQPQMQQAQMQPIMVPGPQMQQPQMMQQPMMQPQMQMIDDSVMNPPATFQPQGMSMTDIVGNQAGISRMGNNQGQGGGALAAAAAMAAQRDSEDASMNPRANLSQMAMGGGGR